MAPLIPVLIPIIGSLLERLIPDPVERQRAENELPAVLAQHETELRRAALALATAEVSHPSIFVAGARPAMTWAAAVGIAYAFVGQPILTWLLLLAAWATGTEAPPPPPQLDVYELITLVGGGSSLYALRGIEKARGVARDNLAPAPDALSAWRAGR